MKKHRPLLILTCLCLFLCSCSGAEPPFFEETSTEETQASPYDGEIVLEGRRYSYRGNAEDISAEADRLIIRKSGSYLLSGELTEGRIFIDCQGAVRLCLGGVSVSSSIGAVIERRGSGELTLEALTGSINYLSSAAEGGESLLPFGCILSEGDIRFTGEGNTVISSKGSGVTSGGDLYIDSGSLTVSAAEHGAFARDRISLGGGTLKITHAENGLYAYGGDYSQGLVEITGGSLVALCEETAVFAGRRIDITGGSGDIRAKTLYKCQREVNGKIEIGQISILSEGFPKMQNTE